MIRSYYLLGAIAGYAATAGFALAGDLTATASCAFVGSLAATLYFVDRE